MCYDISFAVDIKQLADYFPDLVWDDQLSINFENSVHIIGHSYGEHPVIIHNREDQRLHLRLMEWGCIPFYTKDEVAFSKQRASMLNARSERILDDPKSYWHKIRNRRCLVPMTGFYEHRKVKSHKNKIPYLLQLKDQPLFFIPGLYSVAELLDKTTGEITKRWTYTLITRPANKLMQAIHNDGANQGRMVLMLPFELSKQWLDEALGEEQYRAILNYEMPAEALDFKTVWSIRTTKQRPDDKNKNEAFEWEGLEELEY